MYYFVLVITAVVGISVGDELQNIDSPTVYRGSYSYTSDYEEEESILGKAGRDYPSYTEVPKTSFSCKGRAQSGYYADIEAGCQVFHICVENNHKISFLCPAGSVFNQKVLVCDWWYKVDCRSTEDFLVIAAAKEDYAYDGYQPDDAFDLSLAQSGGNEDPKKSSARVAKQRH